MPKNRRRQKAAYYKLEKEFTKKGIDIQKIAKWLGWKLEIDPITDIKTIVSPKHRPKIEITESRLKRKNGAEITFNWPNKKFNSPLLYPKITFPETSSMTFRQYKFTKDGTIAKRVLISTGGKIVFFPSFIILDEKNFADFSIWAK